MKTVLALYILMQSLFGFIVKAQNCNDHITASTPTNRFVVNEQEVYDTQTGLTWRKCSIGQSTTDCSTGKGGYSWGTALQIAESEREKTGKNWRLPNIKELSSIVEEQCDSPAINLTIFPNTNSSDYWTASHQGRRVYSVSFDSGKWNRWNSVSISAQVRLVRTGR